jgi:hypothetical protein
MAQNGKEFFQKSLEEWNRFMAVNFGALRLYSCVVALSAQTGRAFRVIYREEDDLREFV